MICTTSGVGWGEGGVPYDVLTFSCEEYLVRRVTDTQDGDALDPSLGIKLGVGLVTSASAKQLYIRQCDLMRTSFVLNWVLGVSRLH